MNCSNNLEILFVYIQDERSIEPGTTGKICSYYYLSHMTGRIFRLRMHGELLLEELLQILTVRVLWQQFLQGLYILCGPR